MDVLLEEILWLVYPKLILRTDNEPAIVRLLIHAVTEARINVSGLGQVTEERPNTYDFSGSGETETAVKQVTCILRTVKLDLEKRLGMTIPQTHLLMTWMVAYAAWMLTVRVVGSDGRTAIERTRHKPFVKRFVPFGEVVQVYMPLKSPERLAGGALDSRKKLVVVLGSGTHSNSYQIFVDGQPGFYRSIYRLSMPVRWSAEKLQAANVMRKDQHSSRGACAVPFVDRGEDWNSPPRAAPHAAWSFARATSTRPCEPSGGQNIVPNASKLDFTAGGRRAQLCIQMRAAGILK